ncbi:fructose bisphosphate aldolase [Acetobacterium sp.]|jgi:fructose-bisphosphate aldolase class I|uniref:fructose bisphosphate aldolase n=1 Tax=Acetobacterium sp. TaxID=1872094 RepID=UPI000CAABE27|nr:fructose bisphosphate aldolase [Acetobacterium sp.]MDO9490844.1 fructose bisphosphate aldolase [Acetobacterium sp.]PKM75096.1 MAG: fructose bisphosphate aldolase [Firmicutes bacterium HGW-Firmicutes-17]
MNLSQLERMKNDNGFIAALDQSGGSTPKALAIYGIPKEAYADEVEMFQMVHEMRSRIMKSPAFTKERILAAILFEKTMDLKVDGKYSADYLWDTKGILPILKVDKGLLDLENGVQLMKPIADLDALLIRAKDRHIFGTKMRSVIKEANPTGIKAIVDQQFELGKAIVAAGFIPILEPEVDIHTPNKAEAEAMLKQEILEHLKTLDPNVQVMFKLTIPDVDNFYQEIIVHPNVVRTVALSGGYSREESNKKLAKNPKLIASFSRALTEGLNANQSDDEFNKTLDESIQSIYEASIK